MKRFELEGDDKISANNCLRLVIEGFRSTEYVGGEDDISLDAKVLIDYIKNHMFFKKRTPLLGEDLVTQTDGITPECHVRP